MVLLLLLLKLHTHWEAHWFVITKNESICGFEVGSCVANAICNVIPIKTEAHVMTCFDVAGVRKCRCRISLYLENYQTLSMDIQFGEFGVMWNLTNNCRAQHKQTNSAWIIKYCIYHSLFVCRVEFLWCDLFVSKCCINHIFTSLPKCCQIYPLINRIIEIPQNDDEW